jgi:hypothetical protein
LDHSQLGGPISNNMKVTIEINGEKFEAEGNYIPTVLDELL